ncbi:MAG: hypothetical protein WDO56_16910 [Gammaproteobacteria bacterium]
MRQYLILGLMMLVALLGNAQAYSAPPASCAMRLVVELTPDVPDSTDPGFLSSLLNNHPEYQLTWVRQHAQSTIVLKLSGPGPTDRCEAVIDTIRKDGRVMSVHAAPPGAESSELRDL